MSKYILLLFSFLGTVLGSYFTNQDVTIKVKAPTQVNAGEDFTMEVTITKADIERFARFYQELPIGCTATEGESKNAIFTFKDQQAKFIWMPGSLPAEEIFTISYTVHVDQTVSGKIVIPGQFVYIKNNKRVAVDVDPIEITIFNPNGGNDVAQNTDTTSNTSDSNQNYTPENTKLSTNRSIAINGSMATITVKINKSGLSNNFAKVEEFLPSSLQAIAENDGGSLFSFSDHTVKFLWMNIPADNELTVSYKVMKDDGSDITMSDLQNITGSFSYLDGSDTKNLAINTEGNKNTNNNDNNLVNNSNNKKNSTSNTINNTNKQTTTTNQTTVTYSVQICALMKKYRSPKFFNSHYYKVQDKVHLEEHEGWKKYTVGKFPVYKEARDYRVKIWNSTPIKDAFVAAYNSGQRITVQEALMIANQQWYQ